MHDPIRAMPLVHRLCFTWDGWPTRDTILPRPPDLDPLTTAWEEDGFRFRNINWKPDLAQLAFEVDPVISPACFAARVKGRLDHALRKVGPWRGFTRKVAVRAIGDNTNPVVSQYLASQQIKADLADPRYRETLAGFSRDFPEVALEDPADTLSGSYWINLHLVAVTEGRFRMGREDFLPKISGAIPAWAAAAGVVLRRFSMMPDHVHIALRGDPKQSAAEIAFGFYRAMNRAAGLRLFSERVYIGTFSGYTKQDIQRRN